MDAEEYDNIVQSKDDKQRTWPQSVEELKDKDSSSAYCISKNVKASSPRTDKKVAGALTLRLRVKAMQHTIDSQSERLAVLQAIQKAASISYDESTGQVLDAHAEHGGVASAIQEYIK
eukprot:Em0008g314a